MYTNNLLLRGHVPLLHVPLIWILGFTFSDINQWGLHVSRFKVSAMKILIRRSVGSLTPWPANTLQKPLTGSLGLVSHLQQWQKNRYCCESAASAIFTVESRYWRRGGSPPEPPGWNRPPGSVESGHQTWSRLQKSLIRSPQRYLDWETYRK